MFWSASLARASVAVFADVVRVEGRRVGERQNLARARVEHDGRARLRARALDRRLERLLGAELHDLIYRQHHGLTGPRLDAETLVHPAPRVALEDDATGLARQRRVVKLLDPGQPLVVHPDVAEHVRRQIAVRVTPLRLLQRVHALELQLLDRRALVFRHLARDPDETALRLLRLAQPRRERRGVRPDHARQLLRRRVEVFDLAGHREERVGVHAARQLAALPVEDQPAHGA